MSNLRSLLAEYASQISTGNSVAVRELNKAINDFMDSDFCPTSIQQFIEEHYEWQEKMNYVDDLREQGVLYVGRNDSLETSRRRLGCQECYIFYYSQEGSTRALTGMKELFYQLALLNRIPCIAVDIDIHRELAEREGVPAGPRICLYSNGIYKSMSINSEKQMPKYEPCKEQIELIEKLVEDREISECTKQIMLSFDRADFCPLNPYEDRPQQVGFNTTISAPHMHALTLEFFTDKINFDSKILDVGCGTGYLTTCFAKMIGINGLVIGIDHIPELVEMAIKNIKKHHADLYTSGHIKIVEGDGRNGYLNNAPYDIINVGAAAETVPSELINQLKVGGYLIMPVGPPGDQQFMQYFKESTNKIVEKKLLKVRYVALTSKEAQLGKDQRNNNSGSIYEEFRKLLFR
uniref:protein-L-isoaspartate(D-aspartate) O-methyltransferase n=1 Tax=Acrobeloides nanus TaxID=290746 RepID=A0A914DPK4_9BILA